MAHRQRDKKYRNNDCQPIEMPAKRRAPAAEAATPKTRQSKLAKEHNITAAEESEIREAFGLFSKADKDEKEGIIPIGDVRKAMIALGITPTAPELAKFISILDPANEGFAIYSSFVGICALKLHAQSRNSESHNEEVTEAWRLFTQGGGEEKITLATLKGVARVLKEDVDENVLRDMILEANGGAGLGRGVERSEFESVLRRAGVWR